MNKINKNIFEKTAPECVNINSGRIINFINCLERYKLDMHSVLIMRDRKLICEAYYAPFERETLHRMFSVTKSVVSIAIGFLSDEGVIGLDDSITSYFPEYEPEGGFHPYLKETTIRHMLMMTTPHNGTTFDKYREYDWTETFFTKTPTHRPGTVFSYDTSSSHVLAALVEKLTGMKLIDYVRGKGLHELGFSGSAYCLKDGCGVSQGGSGLMARPYDLLILADMLMNYGKVGSKRLVSEEYLKAALSYQVPNFVKGSFLEETQGYGYQFWRTENNGFMMYGMAGQLAVCFPDKNLILVTTADETDRKGGIQQIFDAFYDELYRYIDEPLTDNGDYSRLLKQIKKLRIKPLDNYHSFEIDRRYSFGTNSLTLNDIRIITSTTGGKIILNNCYGKQVIRFGFNSFMDGKFNSCNCPYIASGTWCDENTLVVCANLIGECIGKIIMQFSFKYKNSLTVFSRKTEEVLFSEYSGFAQSE